MTLYCKIVHEINWIYKHGWTLIDVQRLDGGELGQNRFNGPYFAEIWRHNDTSEERERLC